jgi:uncharacterized protein (UPF0303 family)
MAMADDLRRIEEQERRLTFQRFDLALAWQLGVRLKEVAEARAAPVAIDITLHARPLFFVALAGSTADNVEWVRRKRNVTLRLGRSSYAVGLKLALAGSTLAAKYGLPAEDFVAHGGSVPILLDGLGCIGAVTVSGLPQRQDHALVVTTLAHLLGQELDDVLLAEAEVGPTATPLTGH